MQILELVQAGTSFPIRLVKPYTIINRGIMAKQEQIRFLKKSDFLTLVAAAISLIFSLYLFFTGETEAGIFVAIWVPSILGFANFIKHKLGEM